MKHLSKTCDDGEKGKTMMFAIEEKNTWLRARLGELGEQWREYSIDGKEYLCRSYIW